MESQLVRSRYHERHLGSGSEKELVEGSYLGSNTFTRCQVEGHGTGSCPWNLSNI